MLVMSMKDLYLYFLRNMFKMIFYPGAPQHFVSVNKCQSTSQAMTTNSIEFSIAHDVNSQWNCQVMMHKYFIVFVLLLTSNSWLGIF